MEKISSPLTYIPIGLFAGLVPAYIIASWIAFFLTSAGWAQLVILMGGIGVVAALIVIFLITVAVWVFKLGLRRVAISKLWLVITLVVHLAAVLFTPSDGGDAGGNFTFFDRIFNTQVYQIQNEYSSPPHYYIGMLLFFAFPIVFTIFVSLAFAKAKESDVIEKGLTVHPPGVRKNILGAILGAAISTFIMSWLFVNGPFFKDFAIVRALFIVPVILAAALLGSLTGLLFKFPTLSKPRAKQLFAVLVPLALFAGMLGHWWQMQQTFNELPVYPRAVRVAKDTRIFDTIDPTLSPDIAYYPVVTAYYETEATVDGIKTFFDQNFESYDSPPSFGWGTHHEFGGIATKLAQQKKPFKVYTRIGKEVFVHIITDPNDVPSKIRTKLKPDKQYYKIQLYFNPT